MPRKTKTVRPAKRRPHAIASERDAKNTEVASSDKGSRSIRQQARRYLVMCALATVAFFAGKVRESTWSAVIGWFATPQPYVLVIGSDTGANHNLWRDCRAGIEAAALNSAITRSEVRFEYADDSGSSQIAQQVLSSHLTNPGLLAIVGPGETEIAKAMLPLIEQHPDVALIMPIPTNPQLTLNNQKRGISNVFRVPPTDQAQIEAIYKHIAEKHSGKSVAIFRDTTNPDYSNYIATGLRAHLEAVDNSNAPMNAVLLDSIIGGIDGNGLPITDSVVYLAPQIVVYIGMRANALTIARQLGRIGDAAPMSPTGVSWSPCVIFTDGCVDTRLLHLGRNDVDGAYAVFPSGTNYDLPVKYRTVPSFFALGYDSVAVIAEALRSAAPSVSRASFIMAMQVSRSKAVKVNGRAIKFDANGDNIHGEFHLWQVSGGEWLHADECPARHPNDAAEASGTNNGGTGK